jgi:chemotaxis protein methyltransferase CheR
MEDSQCVRFLQWCLPILRLRWAGFRKVRKQVCKRVGRRVLELGLRDAHEYRDYLNAHAREWKILDEMCRITISRFYRDRNVFDAIRYSILPRLIESEITQKENSINIWSAGCGSGEEAYTVKILSGELLDKRAAKDPTVRITATEANKNMLDRCRSGRYPASSLKDLPVDLREAAFYRKGDHYTLRNELKLGIDFILQDIRLKMPEKPFQMILCRNMVFTYFEENLQTEILTKIRRLLCRGGFLVLGMHERLPDDSGNFTATEQSSCIYEKL